MTKRPFLMVCALLIISTIMGCSGPREAADFNVQGLAVMLQTEDLAVHSSINHFDDGLLTELNSWKVDSLATYYFDRFVVGHQTKYTKSTRIVEEPRIADYLLTIRSVSVKRGFTFNFLRPGPIYRVLLEVEGEGLSKTYVTTYEGEANMADLFEENQFYFRPTEEQRNDPEWQEETFLKAFKEALGRAYADFLGIASYSG